MSTLEMISKVMEAQKLRAPHMADAPVFYRNLETVLDKRRKEEGYLTLRQASGDAVDFSSSDFLSLSSSGLIRMAFFDELAKYPDFLLGSSGSRLLDGNSTYVETLEQELADFHGAECGLMFNSGFDANTAIFSVIPQPGDAIVYDELVHASIHEGMKTTRASYKLPFIHNSAESLRQVLIDLREKDEAIRNNQKCVLVSIESVYSMDGDIAPARELVAVAKEIFPEGNVKFIIDEAHSTGLIGKKGTGMICALGLEKDFEIRLHTFGKALGSHGGVVLTSPSVKAMLVNYARCLIYSTAPSFPTLASIRGGYKLLKAGVTQERQDKLQNLVRHFFKTILANKSWQRAVELKIVSMPVADGYETQDFVTHVIPIWTRDKENRLLAVHLHLSDFCAWPIDFPVVPKGEGRVRLVFHSKNTFEEVEGLVGLICEWCQASVEQEEILSKAAAVTEVKIESEPVKAVEKTQEQVASIANEVAAKEPAVVVSELPTVAPIGW